MSSNQQVQIEVYKFRPTHERSTIESAMVPTGWNILWKFFFLRPQMLLLRVIRLLYLTEPHQTPYSPNSNAAGNSVDLVGDPKRPLHPEKCTILDQAFYKPPSTLQTKTDFLELNPLSN